MPAAHPNVLVCNNPIVDFVYDAVCTAVAEHGLAARRYANSSELVADAAALRHADVLVGLGNIKVDEPLIQRMPRLRALVSPVSGTESFDVDAATRHGVLVAHAPTYENCRSMAEAAIMFILALSTQLQLKCRWLAQQKPYDPRPVSTMLHGKTIGVIGYGRIARTFARLLAGWDVEILVYAPRLGDQPLDAGAQKSELDQLMARSDFVCLFAALNAESHHMINRQRLAMMKPSAFLVNVARGGLVDERALCDHLAARRIAGAALDTFEQEPLPADSPLRALDNVILTPHKIGHSKESLQSLAPATVHNVLSLLDGAAPSMVRNATAVPPWNARWGGSRAVRTVSA